MLIDTTTAPPPASDHTRLILWMSVLIGAIVAALLATVVDNLVKGTHTKRAHNSILLLNECFAEHQSAYMIFFIAMLGGADFSVPWAKTLLASVLALSFMFYCLSVAHTTKYDYQIKGDHTCTTPPPCSIGLKRNTKFKMLWVHLVLTVLSFLAAVLFASWTVKPPPN